MKDFQSALADFMDGAQAKVNLRFAEYTNQSATLSTEEGQKYIRVVITDNHGGRSVYCFISKETGDVLKADGWKQPNKKNPRSNIFSDDAGMSGVTGYSTVYLR